MKRNIVIAFVSLFSLVSGSLFCPTKALAIVKFNTDFQNYYRVDQSGNTHVTFVINQKNNLSVVYATDFGLNINETKVSNVKVTDGGIIVIPDVIKTLNQTTISFPFANKVVGKEKIHTFTIEYDTADIATKFGNTWEINIPRLESDENVSSQTVILSVPSGFPTPAYIDPKPDKVENNIYYFSGSKLGNKPISAVFGQTQFYQGKIAYHLSNDQDFPAHTEIALPPDTAYQTVYYTNLSPKPEKITIDADGNYLAKYQIEPNSTIDVSLDLQFKISFVPKATTIQPSDNYLVFNQIWNYDNGAFSQPEIKNLGSAKTIYDFVVDKLKYDYEKVNRQKSQIVPAAESLINSQSAICTDFSNVFVSLARKSGIPARELEGYAISENPDLKPISLTQDVLHSWPEYFDRSRSTWVQIDPTWANTTRGIDYFNKLDFNHLVFVIHGNDPQYPIPAGGYKNKDKNTKDITILPSESIVFPDPEFSIRAGRQSGDSVILTVGNNQGVSYNGNTIVSQSEYLSETETAIVVPPFGEKEIKIKLRKRPLLGNVDIKAIIYLNGNPYERSITIQPSIPKVFVFSVIGVFLAGVTLSARNLYLRRRRQKTSIYR